MKNGKGIHIAKQLVQGRIAGQNVLLDKFGLSSDESIIQKVHNSEGKDLKTLRRRLIGLEGKYTERYFSQIFQLVPKTIRPTKRRGFKAYAGANNVFNLAYTLFFWKCYRALVNARLEPYLGFLHSLQRGRPSLVCDFQELYRYLVDNFVIEYAKNLKPQDFEAKDEMFNDKKGKRLFLKTPARRDMTHKLHEYFTNKVSVRARVSTSTPSVLELQ